MMTQTLALFLDAYRELCAKKMFWIVMILNILFIAGFAVLGVNDHGLTILWFEPFERMGDRAHALFYYKNIFSYAVVGVWLTWIAALLALVSTASIFPDFLSSGSVDLYLAKPISRLRLFFTKYTAGLLFVLLQVTTFSLLSFIVLGLRAGLWEPGLLWAIPLVLVFFSYLFSICTLLGVLTRSTVAALVLTLLAWFVIWAADFSETAAISNRVQTEVRRADLEDRLEILDRRIAAAKLAATTQSPQTQATAPPHPARPGPPIWFPNSYRDMSLPELEEQRSMAESEHARIEVPAIVLNFEHAAHAIKTLVPKTRETTNLLDRVLFQDQELKQMANPRPQSLPDDDAPYMNGPRARATREKFADRGRDRSIAWIVGTSLVFEAVILALAAWYFTTRDF